MSLKRIQRLHDHAESRKVDPETEHRQLDRALKELPMSKLNEPATARMKKRKLLLKDQIHRQRASQQTSAAPA